MRAFLGKYICIFLFTIPTYAKDCTLQAKSKLRELELYQDSNVENVREGNESIFLEGENAEQAVILVHGFMGSPFEVEQLGREINRKGLTVYMPLLSGFGRSTDAANKINWRDWASQVNKSFDIINECYPKVSLAGYSLGASVIAFLALNEERVQQNLKSLTLLSPAIRLKNRMLIKIASPFFPLFDYKIDIQSANIIAKKMGIHDLSIPAVNQEYYNDAIPLKALKELMKLNREIDFSDFSRIKKNRINIVYSEYDKTVNAQTSLKGVTKTHENIESVVIKKKEKLKHQILVREVDASDTSELIDSIVDLI